MSELQGKTAKELLSYFSAKSYADAREAKKQGKLVCWAGSVVPDEFCTAMDVCIIYPENHSAAVGAKKGALPMLEVAARKGYLNDVCSYARVNFGYLELLKEYNKTGVMPKELEDCPAELCPLPDFVITSNNLCTTLMKWYENLAAELNIPCIFYDSPYNYEDEVQEHSIEYMAAQADEFIKELEKICKRPFNYEKFLEAQKQSQRTVKVLDRISEIAGWKPSPMSGFDFFNYMALVVCYRSHKESELCFKAYVEELEAKYKAGNYAMGENEKYRVAWSGIACWPYLSYTYKTFKGMNINMTGSEYPSTWSLHYEPGDMKSMAKGYASIYTNSNLKNRIERMDNVIKIGNCDGLAFHINRSCKIMSFLSVETLDQLEKDTGVPTVMFDGDQTDPRNFAEAQFTTRIQSLQEMMQQKEAE